jgi:hypothetical protein
MSMKTIVKPIQRKALAKTHSISGIASKPKQLKKSKYMQG